MEMPIMDRINGFQNPSFVNKILSLSGFESVSHVYAFWKWGALILAVVATFTSIVKRLRVLIITFTKGKSVILQPLLAHLDDDDDSWSSASSTDDEDNGDDVASVSDSESECEAMDGDFRVAGNNSDSQGQNCKLNLRRRGSFGELFSWPEFTNGKSVVKLWDGLGLGLNLDNRSRSFVSLWDLNTDVKTNSFYCGRYQFPAVSATSPSVVLAAGIDRISRNIGLSVWDTRTGNRNPEIVAEWRPKQEKMLSIGTGGVKKVYVKDDAGSGASTVRDIRNVNAPLEELTESDGETWWDADAVIIADECIDDSAGNGCDSVVSRCRDAVRSYLL